MMIETHATGFCMSLLYILAQLKIYTVTFLLPTLPINHSIPLKMNHNIYLTHTLGEFTIPFLKRILVCIFLKAYSDIVFRQLVMGWELKRYIFPRKEEFA